MEEKQEKAVSLTDLWNVVVKKIVVIIIIIAISVAAGTVYAYVAKPTTYTVTTSAGIKVDSLTSGGSSSSATELNYYSYSVYLAAQSERMLKDRNMSIRAHKAGININTGAIRVDYQEEHFAFTISYSLSGKDPALREQVVEQLQAYLDFVYDYINDPSSQTIWDRLGEDRFRFDDPMIESVSSSTGKSTTIILAFIAGVVISAIFVLVTFFTDDSLSSKEQIEDLTGSAVLTVVSLSPNFNKESEDKKENENKGEGKNV